MLWIFPVMSKGPVLPASPTITGTLAGIWGVRAPDTWAHLYLVAYGVGICFWLVVGARGAALSVLRTLLLHTTRAVTTRVVLV